ncbi:MAG: DEAD/DEAH box helicase [Nitriliruptorales bacterium]
MTKKTFHDLGIAQPLLSALEEQSITDPFPIQELTIPLALAGNDLIGQARTGTGKTLAFGLPLLQQVEVEDEGVQALVITPTRELCLQVTADLTEAGAETGTRVEAVYGGVPLDPQQQALGTGEVDVVVGTPGRLLDLVRRRTLELTNVKMLVLDEADEMLDMGFLPDVEQLIGHCTARRQTLLFSATMASEVVTLARRYLRHPTFIRADADERQVAPDTEQHFFLVHRLDKPRVLARVLQSPHVDLVAVFVRTKRMADRLVEELRDLGVNATAIHGDLRQSRRERNLDRFRAGRTEVLVATEVAARGLDIEGITHVFNYDCPDDERMYLHRIGRTGRAGAAGVAVTFATFNEVDRLNAIRKALGGADGPLEEVFSTSELLTERFDLPPETPWGRFAGDREAPSIAASHAEPSTSTQNGQELITPPAVMEEPRTRARTRVRTRTAAMDQHHDGEKDTPSREAAGRAAGGAGDGREAARRAAGGARGSKKGPRSRAPHAQGDDGNLVPDEAREDPGTSDAAGARKAIGRLTPREPGRGRSGQRRSRGDVEERQGPVDVETTTAGRSARGSGEPTLARRVRIEHLP